MSTAVIAIISVTVVACISLFLIKGNNKKQKGECNRCNKSKREAEKRELPEMSEMSTKTENPEVIPPSLNSEVVSLIPLDDPVPASTLKATNPRYFRSTHQPPPGPVEFVTSVKNCLKPSLTWEKVGVLTPTDTSEDGLLDFYQRSVAPYSDLYEYAYEDKDGFFVPFPKSLSYVEDGDTIDTVLGKQAKGSWKVSLLEENEYVYMPSIPIYDSSNSS